MLRFLLPIALASATLLSADRAEACSCTPRSFAAHAKAETRVFLARAGKPAKTGDRLLQTFTVLATFKGPAQPTFTLDRRATPPCVTNYQENEVAILFTTGGDLDPCHGNAPITAQLDDFAAILDATKTKRGPASADAVERGLREVLPKYLHARPAISIRYAPLAGKSFDVDNSKLTFAKIAAPKDIEITTAFTSGTLAFVAGKYATEGLQFRALLQLDGTTWKILHASAVET